MRSRGACTGTTGQDKQGKSSGEGKKKGKGRKGSVRKGKRLYRQHQQHRTS